MELTLENQYLRVEITSIGAELQSIYHKETSREYLWNGNQAVWDRRSPILFPNCGCAKNGSYTMEGKDYKGVQHGFAKDLNHNLVCSSDRIVTFRLEGGSKTAEFYPYQFALKSTYKLEKSAILCQHKVINYDDKPIYFSFGYHTGIRCPFVPDTSIDDYEIVFERDENCRMLEAAPGGVIRAEDKPYQPQSRRIPITPGVFSSSLILKNIRSQYIQLEEKKSGDYVRIVGTDSPYTVLWSVPDQVGAVCIEPWYGMGDTEDFDGQFDHKLGIQCLAPMEEFVRQQMIEIGTGIF